MRAVAAWEVAVWVAAAMGVEALEEAAMAAAEGVAA